MQVGLSPCHIVLDGDHLHLPKRCTTPVQTAGWIKIPLGTEVDLSPGDIVLDG